MFHNEFIIIWLYIIFAVYFWIQVVLILIKHESYKLSNKPDWVLMFIVTFGIAVSLTTTVVYLIFYPKNKESFNFWYAINVTGVLTMIYLFSFVFFASGIERTPGYFYVCFAIIVVLLVMIIFVQQHDKWDLSIFIVTVTSVGFLSLLFLYDLIFIKHELVIYAFYIPMFCELIILAIAFALLFFGLPEMCCKRKSRFINVYLSSLVLFALLWINVIFESQVIIYHLLKVNSNVYDEDADDWWKFENIYHKGETHAKDS